MNSSGPKEDKTGPSIAVQTRTRDRNVKMETWKGFATSNNFFYVS